MITEYNKFAKSYKMAAEIKKKCNDKKIDNFRLILIDQRDS